MSRKDYKMFAARIKEDVERLDTARDREKIKMILFAVDLLCSIFDHDSPNFSRRLFIDACGLATLERDRKIVDVIEGTLSDHVCDAFELLRFIQEFKDGGAREINFSALYKNDEQTVGQALDRILEQAAANV